VPQNESIDPDFPISVEEVVMMGRYGGMNLLWASPDFKDKSIGVTP
jgi:manganese transport system ATP-binding protein